MKKILASICLSALIFAAATSCTEKIDLELDESYSRLVVDGHVGSDTTAYAIHLTSTTGYFYNGPAPRVVNAAVSLTDGTDTYPLHESEPGVSGIYLTDPDFHGTAGNEYILNITLAEPIAEAKDYSASCRMHAVARLDSIQAVFQPDWGAFGFWEIRVYAQEPAGEMNYYLFQLYRNGTLLTDSIHKFTVIDDTFINGSYITGAAAIYLDNSDPNQSIAPGDTITLKMSGITKEYYDFIYQVQMAGFNIPFFSAPPANVESNISNDGAGFFAAYSSTCSSTFVRFN